jgi:hypothetical protein
LYPEISYFCTSKYDKNSGDKTICLRI